MARRIFIGLLIALVLASIPWWASAAILNIITKVMIAGLFAMSFNLVWGQAGLLSFGQAAYFGIGAFAAIYGMGVGGGNPLIPLPLVPLLGGLAGVSIGAIGGWFATLRSGIDFAMITFALAELLNAVSYQWDAVFGGEAGARARRSDWGFLSFQSTESVYLLTLTWVLAAIAALWWLQKSPFGSVMKGLREREERLAFIGYDTHRVKTAAFCLAAFFSGVAGALLAISTESASVSLFSSHESTNVVLNAIIGGSGVFLGPMLGAAFTTLFGYYAAIYTTHWPLYLGLLFMLVVLFAPQGLGGLVQDALRREKVGSLDWKTYAARVAAAGALTFPTILLIEMVGAMTTNRYAVARRAAGGGWPAVDVFGIAWSPFSLRTGIVVIGCYGAAFLLRRYWAIAAARRIANLVKASHSGEVSR